MDPSRDIDTALRAARALKEAAVAKHGPGSDFNPTVVTLRGGEAQAFYVLGDDTIADLKRTARVLAHTDTDCAVLCFDAYTMLKADADGEGLSGGDLPRLFRARDPRVYECVRVEGLTRDGDYLMMEQPYRYADGQLDWLDPAPPPAAVLDGDASKVQSALGRLFAAGFARQRTRPDDVGAITALQAGWANDLDTAMPDDMAKGEMYKFAGTLRPDDFIAELLGEFGVRLNN